MVAAVILSALATGFSSSGGECPDCPCTPMWHCSSSQPGWHTSDVGLNRTYTTSRSDAEIFAYISDPETLWFPESTPKTLAKGYWSDFGYGHVRSIMPAPPAFPDFYFHGLVINVVENSHYVLHLTEGCNSPLAAAVAPTLGTDFEEVKMTRMSATEVNVQYRARWCSSNADNLASLLGVIETYTYPAILDNLAPWMEG